MDSLRWRLGGASPKHAQTHQDGAEQTRRLKSDANVAVTPGTRLQR